MTVVVADTSPLNDLALIDAIDVLPRLFRKVVIPREVLAELTHGGTPPKVIAWIQTQPDWLEVRQAPVGPDDPALRQIDTGERAAILLAQLENRCAADHRRC